MPADGNRASRTRAGDVLAANPGHLNRHQVKVPVGRIVYAAISPHETIMGRRSGLRRPAFGATPITRASSRTVSHMVRP